MTKVFYVAYERTGGEPVDNRTFDTLEDALPHQEALLLKGYRVQVNSRTLATTEQLELFR